MKDPISWFQAGLVLSAITTKPPRMIVVAGIGWAYARPRIAFRLAAVRCSVRLFVLRRECPAYYLTLAALIGAYGAWQRYDTLRDAFDGFWLSWVLAFVVWSLFRRRDEATTTPTTDARQ